MLCSKCYKKIPEGEEVKRGGSDIYWRAGWWGGEAGRGGVFCLQCAKKEARQEKKLRAMFITLFMCVALFIILSIIYKRS